MTEAHLRLLAQAMRPRQPGHAVTTGLIAALGLGFQLLAWTAHDSFASRLMVALVTGIPSAIGVAFLLRAQLRRDHPLVRLLRTAPDELAQVSIAYVASPGGSMAQLTFELRDRRRWKAYVPEQLGPNLLRDAQATVGAPASSGLPRAIVVETERR